MPKSKTSLKELLHEVRRVEKSREVLTEKKIRKIYQSLVTDLNGFLGNTYAKYADADGRLSASLLQQKGQYAKFLEEIVRNVDGISPEVKKEIIGLVEQTYKNCYTGMVDSVKTATADSPFEKTTASLSVQPTVLNTALNNNISKLTLPTVLEKHRQEVVYDIQQTLNVGLLNGDRYETMAKRITDRIDVSYGKATNIVRTESHRNIEQGLMDGAEQVAPIFNEDEESNLVYAATWCTMLDERVRPNQVSKGKHGFKIIRSKSKANHQKMEGQIIQVGGKFKLEAHVFAKCPGMSGTARNDCNCRCFLEYELLTKEEFLERGGKFLKKPFTNSNNSVNIKNTNRKNVEVGGSGVSSEPPTSTINDRSLKPSVFGSDFDESQLIPEDTKSAIISSLAKAQSKYDIKIDYFSFESLGTNDSNVPFQFVPLNENDTYKSKLLVNKGFEWENNLTALNKRIYERNYVTNILASQNVEDLLYHEMAHFMTYQECDSYLDFLYRNIEIQKFYVEGISLYSDTSKDGAETLAEAFVRMKNNETIDEDTKKAVIKYIERWRKNAGNNS